MSNDEVRAFLSAVAPHTGKLATTRKDGEPPCRPDLVCRRRPHELRHWATVIGGRYIGAGQAEAYGARNGVVGEPLVRLRPGRITSAADVAR